MDEGQNVSRIEALHQDEQNQLTGILLPGLFSFYQMYFHHVLHRNVKKKKKTKPPDLHFPDYSVTVPGLTNFGLIEILTCVRSSLSVVHMNVDSAIQTPKHSPNQNPRNSPVC